MAANNVSTRKGKSFFAKLMERREAMLALIVVAMYIVLSFITPSFMTWSKLENEVISEYGGRWYRCNRYDNQSDFRRYRSFCRIDIVSVYDSSSAFDEKW